MNEGLQNILTKIKDFFKKLWHGIVTAFSAVVRFFKKIVNFIKNHTWDEIKERWAKFREELRVKHRLVIMDETTLREKWSFRLSGINLFVAIGLSVIVLIVLTSLLIALTPLREFIPGYTRSDLVEQTYHNTQLADSLEHVLNQQEIQLENIKLIIAGQQMPGEEFYKKHVDSTQKVEDVNYTHSEADSILRKEIESSDKYQVKSSKINNLPTNSSKNTTQPDPSKNNSPSVLPLFSPLHGAIIKPFNEKEKHYGVDIAGSENSVIKSTYSGTVLLADFTPETGFMVAIQHPNNYISVYKHCASLLKNVGDAVRAGEPIAFLGKSGNKTVRTHLHFELWYNGKPLKPDTYVNF